MAETPQQPTYRTHRGRTDDRTVSRPARRRPPSPRAKPGLLDTIKEFFAATGAVKAASPEAQKRVTGGLPEVPSVGDDANARPPELLRRAAGILTEKATQLVEEYRQLVLQSAKDAAAADPSQKETAAVGEIERALAG